jgi:general secretion pathway protein E
VEESSAVFLFDQMISDALKQHCTDVHLDVEGERLDIRFRVSGVLEPYLRTESAAGAALVRRVKALSRMDITESRLPQDGSFTWEGDGVICDIRVATLPVVRGECVVLRLLPRETSGDDFTQLGMTELQARQLLHLLRDNSGLLLVAGPTGSGKTTTLYTIMRCLTNWGRHVLSIEDPVEMPRSDLHQLEVRERIGLTFASGLKAMLRQDPDAIVIGEIRDEETARIALRAAMTGHLVLSTTHAADVIGTAARLSEFGLSRPLLADVLLGVIVQTMFDKVCYRCQGRGCDVCRHGVLAREPRFQLHPMTPQLREVLASDLPWHDVRHTLSAVLSEPLESVGHVGG